MFTDTMSIVKMLENIVLVLTGSTAILLVSVWGVMFPFMFDEFVNERPDDEEALQVMS